jgi:hypothetical protein
VRDRAGRARVRRVRAPFATGTPPAGGERVGRCYAFHPGAGRCVHVVGHYRARHESAASPHRAADGTEWYGVALRATAPGAAPAPIGGSALGRENGRARDVFTTSGGRPATRGR